MDELRTARLVLRRWGDDDRAALAAVNADPLVMATLGPSLSREQSDALIDRIEACFEECGFGWWCVEVVDGPSCVGFVGLLPVPAEVRPGGLVEIGWRIASSRWGRGYAPEGADAVLYDAFGRLGLPEVVSFTAAINTKSRRVMEKLGMSHDPADDFEHPRVELGDPLRPHVLYRISATALLGRE